MKIFLLITRGAIGGAQMSVLNLATYLRDMGNHVVVGFNQERYLQNELNGNGITTVNFRWLRRTGNPFANLFFILELRKYLDKNNFDVVHLNSSNALIGAIGAKICQKKPKTVFTFRGLSILDEKYESSFLANTFYFLFFKFMLLFIDKPVFVSLNNYNVVKRLQLVGDADVIFNGLDPARLTFLEPHNARHALENIVQVDLNERFLIGSIGRLAYPKNYEFLIKVFPRILRFKDNACAIIIGDGPERENYLNLIRELGLNGHIHLAGEIKDAYQYMKAFDLFVLPSRFEGLSITLIEALFAGLPILTTKVGGSPELLNFCGHQLFNLNDASDFLNKFSQICRDIHLHERLVEQNKKNAARFLLENTAANYLRVYKE
jgi:glycosyltransferase involved in cell wall biosynthesis